MANSRLCSIPDCGKTHYGNGYCNSHHYRFRKYGDPLGGGTLRGEPLRFFNEVAMQHNSDDCLMWPFGKIKGYGTIQIDGKSRLASRYICELVKGPPPTPKHEAAHSCGKGHLGCVTKGHLSWKTAAENSADRVAHGTQIRGERQWSAKLTVDDVREIIALKGIESQNKLAMRFGVSQSAVSNIHRGKNWTIIC